MIALLPRVVFWAEWNDAGLLSLPVVDANTIDQEARGLLNGTWPIDKPFWQAPLYTYFVAGIYWITGVSWSITRLIQAFLGSGTCLLVWFLARRFLPSRWAWLSFGICAFYGPLLYFEGQLLRDTWHISAHVMVTCSIISQ